MSTQATGQQSQQVEPEVNKYWEYYDLHADPFSPDEQGPYFPVSQWEQHFDLIQHLRRYNNVLLSITGQPGVGKTTFLGQCKQQIGTDTLVAQCQANESFTTAQLIRLLIQTFNLPPVSVTHEESAVQLQLVLAGLQLSKQSGVVLIDDAQDLPQSTLEALLQLVKLQAEKSVKFHILLFGTPELSDRLQSLSASLNTQELIHDLTLSPLDLEQTEHYLEYCLNFAGFNGENNPFKSKDVALIKQRAEGNFDKTKQFARQLLIDKLTAATSSPKDETFMKKHLSKIAVLFILVPVFGFALMVLQQNRPAVVEQQDLSLPPLDLLVQRDDVEIDLEELPVNMPAQQPAEISSKLAENQILKSEKLVESPAAETIAVDKLIEQAVTDTAVTSTPAAVEEDDDRYIEIVENQQGELLVRVVDEDEINATNAAPMTGNIVQTNIIATPVYTAVEEELLSISKDQYTLQLLGVHNEADAVRFIKVNNLENEAVYYRTTYQDKDWYVVVYGRYTTIQQARAQVNALPETVKALGPWAKSFDSVHSAIKLAATKSDSVG